MKTNSEMAIDILKEENNFNSDFGDSLCFIVSILQAMECNLGVDSVNAAVRFYSYLLDSDLDDSKTKEIMKAVSSGGEIADRFNDLFCETSQRHFEQWSKLSKEERESIINEQDEFLNSGYARFRKQTKDQVRDNMKAIFCK